MKWPPFTAAVLILLVLVAPQPVGAQLEVQARLGAQVGVVSTQGRLYERETGGTQDWDRSYSTTELGTFPVLGLSIEVGDPRLGVWLKGRVNRSIGLSANFMGLGIVSCTGICLAGSSGPRRFDWRLDASITEAGLDLSLPTRLRLGPFEPYFQGGMGVRRYRFHRPDPSELLRFSPPSDGTAWSFRFGGGTDFSLMGRTFSLSVMDTMTKYWGDRLHHLFVEVSIPVLSRVLFASYSTLQER